MKQLVLLVTIIIAVFNLHGQDLNTTIQLHEISLKLNIPNSISIDTVLIKSSGYKANLLITEQMLYLLRSAECYLQGDFDNSAFYIRKVTFRFKNPDFNTLKYFLLLSGYASTKDTDKTAYYYYDVIQSQILPPDCMQKINIEIAKHYNRNEFDDALAPYFYYHQRQAILDGIKFQ